jgi:hypothetical protein
VGKWAARLAEKTAAPPHAGTDKTAKRGLLSVLAVTPEGGTRDFHATPMPASEPTGWPNAPDLSAVAWTDADIGRFLDRRARLMRWGWAEPEAERLAERLVIRDRDQDARVSCTDCMHYRPGRCGNHRRAGLHSADVGRDLAAMLQRCPGRQPIQLEGA